jgi:plastocyanin
MPLLATAYEGVEVKDGGSIPGVVKFLGSVPPPKPLDLNKDQDVCGKEAKTSEELVVGADKGLRYAVVSLVGITKGKAWSDAPAVLDQKGCQFVPHVVVAKAGGDVEILNNDGILHNFHTYSQKNPSVNKAQPKFKKKMTEKFAAAEVVKVNCDAHAWMQAYIVVAETPYTVVTDTSGAFKLENVPAGTYQLSVWHEKLGTLTKDVTVRAKEETKAAIEWSK